MVAGLPPARCQYDRTPNPSSSAFQAYKTLIYTVAMLISSFGCPCVAQVVVAVTAARPQPDPKYQRRFNLVDTWAKAQQSARRGNKEATPKRAARELSKMLSEQPGGLTTKRPARLARKWAKQLEETGSLYDRPGRGRKSKLTPEAAEKAADIILRGYTDEDGDPAYYTDIYDALKHSAALRRIRRKAELNEMGFWRRLKQMRPEVSSKWSSPTPPLTPEQRQQRIEVCEWLLAMGDVLLEYLKRVFWIDAKKYWVSMPRVRVLCRRDQPAPFHKARNTFMKQNRICVFYYAVVNFFRGPVLYVEVTGTTGLKGRAYKVRCSRVIRWGIHWGGVCTG